MHQYSWSLCCPISRAQASFFSQCRIYWRATTDLLFWLRFIHCTMHSEFFHPLLLLFLFDWLMKMWEITEVVSINCNGFYLLRHASGQMHVNIYDYQWASCMLKLLANTIAMLILPCTGWNHKAQAVVNSCMCSWAVISNTAAWYYNCYQVRVMLDRFHPYTFFRHYCKQAQLN